MDGYVHGLLEGVPHLIRETHFLSNDIAIYDGYSWVAESGNNEVHLSRAPLVTTLLEIWFFQNKSEFLTRSPADRARIYAWGRFC